MAGFPLNLGPIIRRSGGPGRSKNEGPAIFLRIIRSFSLIAPLVLETLPRGELTHRAEEIAARQFDIPASKRTSVSVDTLLDWALRYRNGGFDALAPQPRQDGDSRARLRRNSPI